MTLQEGYKTKLQNKLTLFYNVINRITIFLLSKKKQQNLQKNPEVK